MWLNWEKEEVLMTRSKIEVRIGEERDLPQVFELVKELARFENEPEAVTANLEDYREAFRQNQFYLLVAECNEEIIGMMLYYDTFSTWKGKMMYLEDFVVRSNWRRRGVGQLLFDAFIKDCTSRNAVLAKWQVLDWNDTAINFYKKNKAFIEKEWWNVKTFMKG